MVALVVFNKAKEQILDGVHKLGATADTYNAMLVQASPATAIAVTNPEPQYAAGGTPNPDLSLATNEADPNTSGTYTAGGSSIGTVTLSPTDGSNATITCANGGGTTAWAIDANNPTNAETVVVYNDNATNKPALFYFGLGQTFDMTAGTLTLDWSASLFTLA